MSHPVHSGSIKVSLTQWVKMYNFMWSVPTYCTSCFISANNWESSVYTIALELNQGQK